MESHIALSLRVPRLLLAGYKRMANGEATEIISSSQCAWCACEAVGKTF